MLFESRDKIKSVLSGKSILSRGEYPFLISSELSICIGNRSDKKIRVVNPFFKFLRCSDRNIKGFEILIFFPVFNRFIFFSKVVVGLVLEVNANSLSVHRVGFLLDPEWRASLFAKKYLKTIDFISIKQIFSRFDSDIVCVIFGYNYFWSGKKTRRKVWFLLLSGDGLVLFVLLSKVVLRKIGSRDDAETCEDSKYCPEKYFHNEYIANKEKSLQLKTLYQESRFELKIKWFFTQYQRWKIQWALWVLLDFLHNFVIHIHHC